MRTLIAALVISLFAASAYAADGNISQSTLAKMGLSSMQVVSDAQGDMIRGMGYRGGYQKPSNFSLYQSAYVSVGRDEAKSTQKVEGPCDCSVPEVAVNGALIVKYEESGKSGGYPAPAFNGGGFGGTSKSLTIAAAGSYIKF